MDEINIETLCILLETQKKALSKLLDAEKEKSKILEKIGAEGLDSIMNKEQALIMECSATEKKRLSLCKKFGVETVSELIEKHPEFSEKIIPLRDQLISIAQNIKKTEELNARLLNTRLKLIKFISSEIGINNETVKYGKEQYLSR